MPEWIGNVRTWGDASFDSAVVCDDSERPMRWLSYPFSRLVLNPNTTCTDTAYMEMDRQLGLSLGYLVGDQSVTPYGRDRICMVRIMDSSLKEEEASAVRTTWYPYQLAYEASYSGQQVRGYDFFADRDTVIRVLERSVPDQSSLVLFGETEGKLRWDASRRMFLIENAHEVCAMSVLALDDAWCPQTSGHSPEIGDGMWRIVVQTERAAFIYAFATREEGIETATRRLEERRTKSVRDQLDVTKRNWDAWLGALPAPGRWGIRAVDPWGIAPERHRMKYYAAWTFLLSNTLPETPERGFPYRQVTIGKASLWGDGSPLCPTNCAWESFFEIQLLAYVDPGTAWSALEGFMSMIDHDGWLEGECLPSQKAHTAWVVHRIAPDRHRLIALYPALRRYLLWREDNPYWVWSPGGPEKPEKPSDQKDISFVSQWMTDVDDVIQICEAIGETEDAVMWRTKKANMVKKVEQWFFAGGCVQGIYWEETDRREDNVLFTIDMLVHRLTPNLDARLMAYYLDKHHADQDLVGLAWSKFGNIYHTLRGLYDQGYVKQADELADSLLRHTLLTRDFCENEYKDRFEVDGVNPSAFTACQVIVLTWMRNGMRVEKGIPYEMDMNS